MTTNNKDQGWHGDPEGHAEAARERDKTNWWPLLAIPLALAIGWAAHGAMDNDRSQAYQNSQYGVGGSPDAPCVTPIE